MAVLDGMRVAIIALDGFEESELTEPLRALRAVGAQVDVLSLKPGKIQGYKHHDKSIQVEVDYPLSEISPDQYDAVVLPGGALNADAGRIEYQIQAFLRALQQDLKPMAVICHAPWLLISADLVRGRTLTSYKTIQDDVRNAGGAWVDQEVVVDGNWVTSRQPADLPAFIQETIKLIAGRRLFEATDQIAS